MKSAWLLVILLAQGLVVAQNVPPPRRPTIGVALEGGGAKGFAHIGVLQWFEDNHIPIDYVAGTSMGGLIGGFYAAGYRPPEIQEIVEKINWNDVLSGDIPFSDLSFRRKEDARTYPNALVVGLRHGVTLPGGLNSGQSVRILMDRYMLPYSGRKSFDDLPIPFRCVATDLVTGQPRVFSQGSLANALRATMSLPGVFAPVRENGQVYADGGMLDNLPTDVVKQMGADIVIGVHLSIGPTSPKSVRSLLGVLGAASSVMIDANVLRGMQLADILITVDVAGFGTLEFSRSGQIIVKGVEAAQAKASILSRLSLNPDDWNRYVAQREARRARTVPVPEFIEVTGTRPDLAEQMRKQLARNVGQPIDTQRIEKDIVELMGLDRFQSINYSLIDRDGEPGLLIIAEEKDYSPPWLKPGFEFDGSEPNNVGFTFASRVTFLDVGGFRSEARLDFSFGTLYGIRAEYYHPFTPLTHWFIAPQVLAASNPIDRYSENTLLAEYRVNTAGVGADVGYQFSRFSELRFGYLAGYLDTVRQVGSPLLPSVNGRTGATKVGFLTDHLDRPIIPRQGWALQGNMQWVDANPGAKAGFPSAEIQVDGFRPVSKSASVYAIAAGGSTFGYHQTGLPEFMLGGPSRLAAFGINEFLVNQYWYARLGYLHQIGTLPSLAGGGIYLTGEYEIAKPYGLPNSPSLAQDGVVGLITQTVLGPFLIGGSIGDAGHRKWFFQLGRVF
jgi:NTE family protein